MPPSAKKQWSARGPPRRHRSPNTCLQAPGNTLLLDAVFHCKNTKKTIFLQNYEKSKSYVFKKLFKQLQTIANAIGKTQTATIFARGLKRPKFCFKMFFQASKQQKLDPQKVFGAGLVPVLEVWSLLAWPVESCRLLWPVPVLLRLSTLTGTPIPWPPIHLDCAGGFRCVIFFHIFLSLLDTLLDQNF